MQRLKVEDQIQFTYIFEKAVEGFDKDLDEVEEGEGRFRRRRDQDEIEGCVVAVCNEGGGVIVGLGWGCGGRGSCS